MGMGMGMGMGMRMGISLSMPTHCRPCPHRMAPRPIAPCPNPVQYLLSIHSRCKLTIARMLSQNFQSRQEAMGALQEAHAALAQPGDLVLLSDIDEIPRERSLEAILASEANLAELDDSIVYVLAGPTYYYHLECVARLAHPPRRAALPLASRHVGDPPAHLPPCNALRARTGTHAREALWAL